MFAARVDAPAIAEFHSGAARRSWRRRGARPNSTPAPTLPLPTGGPMQRPRLAIPAPLVAAATLVAAAGCTSQQPPAASEEFVPHGRFTATMERDQAMRECRQQVESVG